MRLLRWVIVLVLLLQLTIAELSSSDEAVEDNTVADNADQVQDSSAWSDEAKTEDAVEEVSTDTEVDLTSMVPIQEEAEPEEVPETPDEPYERKLSPRERMMIEEEERWQRGMEELAEREREATLHELNSGEETPEEVEADAWERSSYPEEQYEQTADQEEDDDETLAAYLERKRRLEESADQTGDGDEEEEAEALPVIPGLTDVELIAFNAEYANAEVLEKIIDWSYDQVAALSRFRDNYIHVEDLYHTRGGARFLLKTLNPLDEDIDLQDEQVLTDAVTELRSQQGLVDEEQVVYRGFIARGMPLRFLQSLAHEMHQTVQTRRLQANDEL
uniref:RxLR effector protein n=1 Tax=Phytophthora ramorum TaxID=164328 RepID=H3HAS2_PHYRM